MTNGYINAMDSLHFSDQDKDRMARRLAAAYAKSAEAHTAKSGIAAEAPSASAQIAQGDISTASKTAAMPSAAATTPGIAATADNATAKSDAAPRADAATSDGSVSSPAARLQVVAPKRRRIPAIAAAAAAFALVACIGGGAYASGALVSVSDAIDDIFGTPPANTEVIDAIGRPIGASASAGGIIITADAVIGDARNYVVVYSISKDDGSAFNVAPLEDGYLPLIFEDAISHVSGVKAASGGAYFYDADPDDNAIQYVEEISTTVDDASDIIGKTARIEFGALRYTDDAPETPGATIAEGSWKLKFTMNYEDTSIALDAGQAFDMNGMGATIERASISPIALDVEYLVEGQMDIAQESGRQSAEMTAEMNRFYADMSVVLSDGTVIDASNAGRYSEKRNGATLVHAQAIFDQMIDLDEVESVVIEGAEIPLG